MRGRLIFLLSSLTALLITASVPTARADLLTYGYSNARLGALIGPGGVPPARVAHLRVSWRASVGSAVTAQPLFVQRVAVGARRLDLVIVADEHGSLAAFDADRGTRVWQRQLGHRRISPDCQSSPDGEFGITGTPVVDRRTARVYVVDARGVAWALSLSTGRVVSGWPVRVHPQGSEFVWGALALFHGRLYVPIASLCDSGHYYGGISSVALTGQHHPVHTWRTTGGSDAYAGGIWGWGGVSIDESRGDLYAATGNSLGTLGEDTPHAESVVRLNWQLQLRQWNDPLLGPFQSTDRDFGTTPVLIHAHGCPAQAVAINKAGQMFLYDRLELSAGPVQRIPVASDTATGIPLYGIPAWDAASRTLVLTSPSSPPGSVVPPGVRAYRLTSGCRLGLRWAQPKFNYPYAGSPPTIAAGVVYLGSGRSGWIRAYRLRDGRQLWSRHLSQSTIMAAPAVAGGTLFTADWKGRVWALRPH